MCFLFNIHLKNQPLTSITFAFHCTHCSVYCILKIVNIDVYTFVLKTFLYFMSIRLQENIWHYNISNVRAISGIYKYNIVVSFSEKATFQTIGMVIDVPVQWRPPMAFACPARRVRVGVSILHGHRRRGVIKPCFVVHINIVAFNTGAWSVWPYLYSCGNLYFFKHHTFIIIYGKT